MQPAFPYAAALRRELAVRAQAWAQLHHLDHALTYGQAPMTVFSPDDAGRHGNFIPASYRALLGSPLWLGRLEKSHTTARRCLPRAARRWRELDSAVSSDALLMNIFCYPRLAAARRRLGTGPASVPEFGYRARVPLVQDGADRTEVDMRLDHLLVEAKLTESDFQTAPAGRLAAYRDAAAVFLPGRLDTPFGLRHYQLVRGVLAAHASQSCFLLLCDARRPDLMDAWGETQSAVRDAELRTRLLLLTWQELATSLPRTLQQFLAAKYGISSAPIHKPSRRMAESG